MLIDRCPLTRDHQQMVDESEKSLFQQRFDAVMAAMKCPNRAAWGRKIGVASSQTLYNWYERDQKIPEKERKRLAQFGISIDWVNDGDGAMSLPGVSVSPSATAAAYVRVQQLDAEAGMGGEMINDDYPEVIRAMDFEPAYIRSVVGFVPSPGRLVLVTGRGDSMIPVIQPGESLMVDTGIGHFDGDGIYLINTGNGQQIKGLQDRGDSIYVVSANTALYPAFPLPKSALIGGKVYLRNRIDRLN
ncbi:S24 family peptidase [Stenotrophomonas maltophilia group sp. Smal13]|uniref:LexA family transcriptional regulator n=1 Tax=Stenotrophomonas maltophilia group sp. Smal13 TaxID=3377166 RepID=UPI0025559592|nr:S24 family peptidase [Stenotrophomonas maltophilia]